MLLLSSILSGPVLAHDIEQFHIHLSPFTTETDWVVDPWLLLLLIVFLSALGMCLYILVRDVRAERRARRNKANRERAGA